MNRYKFNVVVKCFILILILNVPIFGRIQAQSLDTLVTSLVDIGYENVSRTITETEEIITFENGPRRVNGIGVRDAMRIIEKTHSIEGKLRRVVVLSYNVPQISLIEKELNVCDTLNLGLPVWDASYSLGDSWNYAKKTKRVNRSLGKIDIVIYPQFGFRNQKYHKVYDFMFNLAPALEISPVKGMKLTGQIIFPIVNEYEKIYDQVRPGFLTVEQMFRVENIFATATVGLFNKNRWGVDLNLYRPFTSNGWGDRFALEARIGLTGSSFFDHWEWNYGSLSTITWNAGASYYNARFNTMCAVRMEKYLAGDLGVRVDVMRNFRNVSVGLYAMHNNRGNLDGGFYFAIALPPYKQKRGKYIQVRPATYFDLEYNAAGLFYNGMSYKTTPGYSKTERNFNPFYIESQVNNNINKLN